MSEYFLIPPNFYSMLFDGMMMLAIIGLWVMWLRSANRQQHVEAMLADTAKQLDEATFHLEQAMAHMHASNKKPHTREKNKPVQALDKSDMETSSILEASHAARMLRMQREGESLEGIATRLGIPLAQVKLMQKLQVAKN